VLLPSAFSLFNPFFLIYLQAIQSHIEAKEFSVEELSLSKFMYETIAGGFDNQLPISSVCNGRCIFCSNEMNPFPILREGFRPLDDIKKGIELLNFNSKNEIRLGDSLPGRISEGEAFLHPHIFEVLQLIRERSANQTIQVTTNGTMLTNEFIEKLVPYKPLRVTISYHSDVQENWCRIFRLGEKEYHTARYSFFQLLKNKIATEAIVVAVPRLVGYDDLENTIKALRIYTDQISIYPPGYSDEASSDLKKSLEVDYGELSRFLITMRKRYNVDLALMTDLLKPLDFYPLGLMKKTHAAKFKRVLWLFSEAAHEQGSKILAAHERFVPNRHYAARVKNTTYGGNIICAGLLMVTDFRAAISSTLERFRKDDTSVDLMMLPKIAFDRFGDDLKGDNHSSLREEFKKPVWVR